MTAGRPLEGAAPPNFKAVASMCTAEAGGLDYARERALRLADQADLELDLLPQSAARDALRASIAYVVDRRR